MARKRKRKGGSDKAELEMTPMIDVVFQLLIFFIVTLKQQDLLAHMDISRPAPDPDASEETPPDNLLDITVFDRGYSLRGKRVGVKELDRQLSRIASYSKNVSVIIKCTGSSPHGRLVKLLDICAKNDLKKLSVFSM